MPSHPPFPSKLPDPDGMRILFETAATGYIMTDLIGRVEYFNPFLAELFGVSSLDSVKKKFTEVLGIDLILGGKADSMALSRRFLPPETSRPVDAVLAVHLIRRSDESPWYYLTVVNAVALEERPLISESEKLFRYLMMNLPVGVLLQGPKAEFLHCNPKALDLLGLTEDQILGKTSFDQDWNVIHEDGSPFPGPTHPVPRAIAARASIRQVIMGVFRPSRCDRVWLSVDAEPRLGPGGEVEQVICTFVDISEHKKSEEARLLRDRAIQAISQGIVIAGPDWNILFVNRAFTTMTGYQSEEVLGRSCRFLMGDHPDLKTLAIIRRALREWAEYSGEVLNRRKDGTLFWDELTISPVVDSRQTLTHFIGVLRDVTQRKSDETAKRDLEHQLQQSQKMESVGLLASGVAHDINNVLTAISATVSVEIDTLPRESPYKHAFDAILRAVQRGKGTVSALLNLTRKELPRFQSLDWNQVIEEQVTLLQHSTLAQISVRTDLEPLLTPIEGDPGTLGHALVNLCVNALDAMKDREGERILTLRTRNEDRTVVVEVIDNGCGMDSEVRSKALDPFFTTKARGVGTGLGLSLVYTIVQSHRGQISLESEPELGTKVRLVFPARGDRPATIPLESGGADEGSLGPLTVLLVDDDDLVRESMEILLDAFGCTVTGVQNGEAALEALGSKMDFDLVVLDMNMPGLGGPETLRRIRSLRGDLPVLVTTGLADQSVINLVKQTTLTVLIGKPFVAGELKALIRAVLRS